MVSVAAAWHRISRLQSFAGLREQDFRPIVYSQTFSNIAAGATSPGQNLSFSGGAVILGVTSQGFKPAVAVDGQSTNNRNLYALNFSFTTGESLTPNGPVLADALLGGGDDTIFPVKEILLAPTQSIVAACQNVMATDAITVHVLYHCLVYRFGA
jgi:hypothetical protein